MQCVCQIELELRLRTHDLTHWTLDTDFKKYFAGISTQHQARSIFTMVFIKQQCFLCEYKTTKQKYLKRHIKSVHEEQKFPCIRCESIFTLKGNLQKHTKSVHES